MSNDWGFGGEKLTRRISDDGMNDHNRRLHEEKVAREVKKIEERILSGKMTRLGRRTNSGRTVTVWGNVRIRREPKPMNWGRLLDDE